MLGVGHQRVTVNYLAAGTCVIDANQAAGNGYAAAPQVQQTITVSTADTQTITFPSPGPGVVGQSATLTATGGGSGNPVVFSVDASSGRGVLGVGHQRARRSTTWPPGPA